MLLRRNEVVDRERRTRECRRAASQRKRPSAYSSRGGYVVTASARGEAVLQGIGRMRSRGPPGAGPTTAHL